MQQKTDQAILLKIKQMNNYISLLDSERFGFLVAKFSNTIQNPEQIVNELKNLSTKLIIARVDFNNLKLINQLEKIGFEYKDAQLTFSFDLKKEIPTHSPHKDFKFTSYRSDHFNQIIEMTKKSFNNYGHYFADEKLNKQKCLDIYIDWITRCCTNIDVADNIIVAEIENTAVGYLALKTYITHHEKYIAGVIGAVSPEFRKLGIFQKINIESMHLAKKLGANRVENNVLVTNFPVINTYTNLSYNIIKSEITMHYWCC